MNLEIFQNKVKEFEALLVDIKECNTKWIDEQYFYVEPKNENYSTITISYVFDEVRVGIDQVLEYYSDEYEEGRKYKDGFNRFNKILKSKIKRRGKYKGNFHFRTDYLIEKDGKFEKFASMLFWAFPFWRKTKIIEHIQHPILKSKI